MEVVNFTPKELRKTLWTVAGIVLLMIFVWKFADIAHALLAWWRFFQAA